MGRYILTTLWTRGEVLPFIMLGQGLAQRGHEVTLVTHCHYAAMATSAGLDFAATDTPDEYQRFVSDGRLFNDAHGFAVAYESYVLPKVHHEYERILALPRADRAILVARALPGIAARMVSEKLNIPLVPVLTTPHLNSTRPLLAELFAANFGGRINDIRARADLPPIRDWGGWLSFPEQAVALWPEWFSNAEDGNGATTHHAHFLIAPSSPSSAPLPEFIASERPILITGGSGFFVDADHIAAALGACQLLRRPAILVTSHMRLVPETLPSDTRWFPYLPFEQVMPAVAAVIHHGGIGTSALALAAGIPQLIIGSGSDRPDNANRLRQLGVADYLPPRFLSPERLAQALTRLLASEPIRERCQQLSQRFQGVDAIAKACDLVTRLGTHDEGDQVVSVAAPDDHGSPPAAPFVGVAAQKSPTTRHLPQSLPAEKLALLDQCLLATRG